MCTDNVGDPLGIDPIGGAIFENSPEGAMINNAVEAGNWDDPYGSEASGWDYLGAGPGASIRSDGKVVGGLLDPEKAEDRGIGRTVGTAIGGYYAAGALGGSGTGGTSGGLAGGVEGGTGLTLGTAAETGAVGGLGTGLSTGATSSTAAGLGTGITGGNAAATWGGASLGSGVASSAPWWETLAESKVGQTVTSRLTTAAVNELLSPKPPGAPQMKPQTPANASYGASQARPIGLVGSSGQARDPAATAAGMSRSVLDFARGPGVSGTQSAPVSPSRQQTGAVRLSSSRRHYT